MFEKSGDEYTQPKSMKRVKSGYAGAIRRLSRKAVKNKHFNLVRRLFCCEIFTFKFLKGRLDTGTHIAGSTSTTSTS